MLKNTDMSKFGNPVKYNGGKKFAVTPTSLKGNFRNVPLDARAFNFPSDWAILSVSRKSEYTNDKNGKAEKTGRNYLRFGLINGSVARPLVKAGIGLKGVSILPVRCDCYSDLDPATFKVGEFVKLVKPLVFAQWQALGNRGGSYTGARLVVENVRKESKK